MENPIENNMENGLEATIYGDYVGTRICCLNNGELTGQEHGQLNGNSGFY